MLRQTLLNLLRNAAEAIPEGNATRSVFLRVESENDLNRKPWTVIEVRDTGSGIAPAQLRKIFIPFFTTKPKGHGVGLALSHRVITQHGGTLTALNAAEGGAVFTIDCRVEMLFWKVFAPAFINQPRNVLSHNQFIWKSGLCTGIYDNRRLVNQMMPLHCRLRSVNIRRRLETRPRRPQKIRYERLTVASSCKTINGHSLSFRSPATRPANDSSST